MIVDESIKVSVFECSVIVDESRWNRNSRKAISTFATNVIA